MALMIEMVEIDGEKRVAPAVMKILADLAKHRDNCRQCAVAMKMGTGWYCDQGAKIVLELKDQPTVKFVTDGEQN